MPKTTTQFVCSECGYVSSKWLGRCPECGKFNSLIEEAVSPAPAAKKAQSAFRPQFHPPHAPPRGAVRAV